MRVRGRRLLPLLIALLVMAGAFCYGAVRTSGEMWSHLETGSVKIGIETLGLEHGTFRKLPQEVIVDCEKPVSYVPRITNRGETCYLRVRLLAKAGDQELELADHLQDIQSGWIRKIDHKLVDAVIHFVIDKIDFSQKPSREQDREKHKISAVHRYTPAI